MHCAVVVYSVCHVILHLGVSAVERRGRTLRTVGGLWQSVNTVCCVRVSLIPTSPLSAILVLASSRHSDA